MDICKRKIPDIDKFEAVPIPIHMETKMTPVVFTAFANPEGDLVNLTKEQNGIQDALRTLNAKGNIKHISRTDTDLEDYFDFLQDLKNQIRIFHFAGHADSEGLSLQNGPTFFESLAEELVHRNKESLVLAFLNGCSTFAHVQTLFDLGVPAVIATSALIDDTLAGELAIRFYKNLAGGDSIKEAYRSAATFVKGNNTAFRFRNLGAIQTWRTIAYREKVPVSDFPWGLYVREEGILEERGLLDKDNPLPPPSEKPNSETKHSPTQNAEKIYNIGHIDNANFS